MVERAERHAAMQSGDATYFTGRPCLRGHLAFRTTKDGKCIECRRIHDKTYYWKDPAKTRNRVVAYGAKNRELQASKAADYRQRRSPEQMAADRERAKLKSREWRKNNPSHRNFLKKQYVAVKSSRVPKWADRDKILWYYKNCPSGWHVDHIIPLRGKNVCGLHVETNLQWLPAIENMRKNNRMLPA
jgi:hypothetical protein